jgi:predicted transcriptional regulator
MLVKNGLIFVSKNDMFVKTKQGINIIKKKMVSFHKFKNNCLSTLVVMNWLSNFIF